MEAETRTFKLLPAWRLNDSFPAFAWVTGWFLVLRGILWLVVSPEVSAPAFKVLGYKYLLCTIPFMVLGAGVWNLRTWARWGVGLLSGADLVFFLLSRPLLWYVRVGDFLLLNAGFSVVSGPIGGILLLIALPALKRCEKA